MSRSEGCPTTEALDMSMEVATVGLRCRAETWLLRGRSFEALALLALWDGTA